VAKGILPPPDALHISYVLTPMRYAWDMYSDYFGGTRNRWISFFMHYLRMWDVTSSQRVDHFLCVSKHVENRIKKFYRREAIVIPPPVETKRFKIRDKQEDFFLIVSSLAPYKRIDLAIEALNQLGYPLRIIGSGPGEKRLRSMARSNVAFLGWQPDDVVADFYSKCRALIFPGEEDFGIVPLEAMASGRPVIAYGRGGAMETIIPYDQEKRSGNLTGIFFYEQSVASMIEAVEQFKKIEQEFNPEAIRDHVLQWDRKIFKEKIKKSIFEKVEKRC
jgi:glycosyltransferase involved in cell wall biosynthesis